LSLSASRASTRCSDRDSFRPRSTASTSSTCSRPQREREEASAVLGGAPCCSTH
jgi:hypothetical protein